MLLQNLIMTTMRFFSLQVHRGFIVEKSSIFIPTVFIYNNKNVNIIFSLSFGQMQSIIDPFDFSETSTLCDKSSYIRSHSTNGFYFPQFQQVFYLRLTEDMLKKQTLDSFVRSLIEANIQTFQGLITDPQRQRLTFQQLVDKPSPISGNIQMRWNKQNRVIVRFQRNLNPIIVQNKNRLILKLNLNEICLLQYDIYKKFQVRDIYVLQKLTSYRFTAMKVGKEILKHYDTLDEIEAVSQITQVFPLFTFQVFYHQMHQISTKHEQILKFELLLRFLGISEIQATLLRQLYDHLHSSHIDKLILYLLLNLIGINFSIINQRQFVLDYFHGNIEQLQQDDRSLMTSLMLQQIQKLPNTQVESIFFSEDFDQLNMSQVFKQQQIVRIQVFCRANTHLRQLNLRSGKEYHIYQIHPLTAKDISTYTLSPDEHDHIILPFNDYLIEEKHKQNKKHFIKLRELPTPKYLETNLVIWISDNFDEARQFQQRSILLNKQNNQEVMLIKNNKIYQVWLKRYYPTIAQRKICVVYKGNMISQGLNSLELTRSYFGSEINLVFYTEQPRSFSEQLSERMEKSEKIKVTNSYRSVLSFVVSNFKSSGVFDCDCQECKCNIC